MFIQVIEGTVTDPARVREALDGWRSELSGGATGWLGSTAGVTEDGRFLALARFESEEAARRNSDRPEQDRWWSEVAGLFEGEPTFRESTDIDVDLQGDPDKARFVQVIKGRSKDPERSRKLMNDSPADWSSFRPDILGSVGINHPDGAYTVALYFTSEAEAREGEQKDPPAELKAQMEEMAELEDGEPSFLDLKEPWLYSPR